MSKILGGLVGSALALSAALTLPVPARAATLLGAAQLSSAGAPAPSNLYAIDSTDGTATLIGAIGFKGVSGMDFNAGGTLYATGFRPADGVHVLITIDPATGAGTEVGPTGVENTGQSNTADISFRPSNGALFAYAEPGDDIGTINVGTGAYTLLNTGLESDSGNAIAFSPGGVLYHLGDHEVNKINPTTGVQSEGVPLVFPDAPATCFFRINAADFSPGGTLVASLREGCETGPESHLAVVDVDTGNVEVIGTTVAGLDAIAIPPGADIDAPSCEAVGNPNDSSIQINVQDTGSGLSSIEVLTATNADAIVPPFTTGTNGVVVVNVSATDTAQPATVQVKATDVAGNVHTCDAATFNVAAFLGSAHVGFEGASSLYWINSTDGTATLIGPIGFNAVSAMDFDDGGTLYATGFRPGGGVDGGVHVLITINPLTGVGTEVGPTDIESAAERNTPDMSFQPSTGTLFAYTELGDDIGTIDVGTGAYTPLNNELESDSGNAIAFSPGGVLYHLGDHEVNTIDPTTGEESEGVPLVFPDAVPSCFFRIDAADFSPGGTLVASLREGCETGPETYLAVAGVNSGAVEVIGTTVPGLDAIAIPPGVEYDNDIDFPSCEVVGDTTTDSIQINVQDIGSGLASIEVLQADNADVVVPAFTPGTKDVVVVSATAVDANSSATVQLKATDVEGNVHTCDAVTFNVELVPPTCTATGSVVATDTLSFTAQDTGHGLASVTVIGTENATASIPSFTPGTTDPVVVSVTPIDPALRSLILFQATDRDGNVGTCPPVVWERVTLPKNGQTKSSLTVSSVTSLLTVENGTPGFDRAKIAIGRVQQRQSLTPGQVINQDLSNSLSPNGTTVAIQAWGKSGAAALFMFSDEFLP